MALQDGKVPDTAGGRRGSRAGPARAPATGSRFRVLERPDQDEADEDDAPNRAARGLILGLAIGLLLWAAIIAVAWRILKA